MGKYGDTIVVKIDELKPHPLNEELFSEPSAAELEELKSSLRNAGQIDDIIINEDNRILSGHWRVKGAKDLGWKELRAKIFYPDYPEEERRILCDSNVARRHLDALSLTRLNKIKFEFLSEKELVEYLAPELQEVAKSGGIQRDFLISLAQLDPDQQLRFLKEIEIFQTFFQDKHSEKAIGRKELEALDQLEEQDKTELEQVLQEKKKIELEKKELEVELIKHRELSKKLTKDRMGLEVMYKKATEDVFKLSEQVREFQSKNAPRSEEDSAAAKELQRKIRQLEKERAQYEKELNKKRKEAQELEKQKVLLSEKLRIQKEDFEKAVDQRVKDFKEQFRKKMEEMERKEIELVNKVSEVTKERVAEVIDDEVRKLKSKAKKIYNLIASIEFFLGSLPEGVEYALELKRSGEEIPVNELEEALNQLIEGASAEAARIAFEGERKDSFSK